MAPKIDLAAGSPVEFLRADEIRAAIVSAANITAVPTSAYLIKGWLDREGISLVYGKSNVGKTFFAVGLAFHVGAGQPWNGCRVRKGNVLYIAAEGQHSVARRFLAVEAGKGDLHAEACHSVYLLPLQVDLHGPEDVPAIIREAGDRSYALIVVDTLARSFGAGDENAGNDMGAFIANIAALRAHFGCHVMIVHHEGKDASRGARGHSSLRAAVDTEISLRAEGLLKVATIEKQRDGATGIEAAYSLEVLELGHDEDGDPITSCVVRLADAELVKAAKGKKPLTGNDAVMHQALCDAIRDHGEFIRSGDTFPRNRRVVSKAHWRSQAERRGLEAGKSEAAWKQAFTRAAKRLQDLDYIRILDDRVWLIDGEQDIHETDRDIDYPVPDIPKETDRDSSLEGCPLSPCPDIQFQRQTAGEAP